jgi:deoxyribonuclease V
VTAGRSPRGTGGLFGGGSPWPHSDDELVALQHRLAAAAVDVVVRDPWVLPPRPRVAGCFVAFARGEAGPGRPGDRAWVGAVLWEPPAEPCGVACGAAVAEVVVASRVPAAYAPGLLARREGPALAEAIMALAVRPDVLLVDATGRDHPRRAGLALHLGAAVGLPTVGVTHRPLVATGLLPAPRAWRRGTTAPLVLDGEHVASWVCTRSGARPVVAHAGWRTTPETAVELALATSTEDARTPVPLQEARRAARAARARAT